MRIEKKRCAHRSFGYRRVFLWACMSLCLLCSVPLILTSPELHWHIDSNIWLNIITPEPAIKESDVIAFICHSLNGGSDGAIYTIRPDGSHLKQIWARPHEAYNWISWSPDGKWLATVSRHHSALYMYMEPIRELYRVRFDGFESRRLTYNRYMEFAPNWSRDGKSISYVSDEALHRVSFGGNEISQSEIPNMGLKFWDRLPFDWSSDDQQLVIAGADGSIRYSANPDGSDLQLLTQARRRVSAVEWAPNDEQILYSYFDVIDELSSLHVFNVKNRTEDFALSNGFIRDALWSPDSRKIAIDGRMFGAENRSHLSVLNLISGNIDTVTALGSDRVSSFSWSPDSEWIAFSILRHGPPREIREMYKIKRDGSGLQQLVDMDCDIDAVSWSPN